MILTKTQVAIMEKFVAEPINKFSIKSVAENLKKPYPLIHRSVKPLMTKGYFLKDEHGLLSLNYQENHALLAYIEMIRTDRLVGKNKTIKLFAKDFIGKSGLLYLILLIFGSYARGRQKGKSDIDVLAITEDEQSAIRAERIAKNIASDFSENFDINVVSLGSAYEMLKNKKQSNILNEALNNHAILFGAENFYRMVAYAIG